MRNYLILAVLTLLNMPSFAEEPILLNLSQPLAEKISASSSFNSFISPRGRRRGRGRGRGGRGRGRGRGQESESGGMSFGFRGGLNLATVEGVEAGKGYQPAAYKTINGIAAGAVLNLGIGSVFSIQPELLFIQKGYHVPEGSETVSSGGFSFERKIPEEILTLNYIEIPVLAKFSFGGDAFQFFFDVGPTVGFVLSGTFGDSEATESLEFGDGFNRLEIGVAGGPGFGIGLGPGKLLLESRFSYGITSYADGGYNNFGMMFGLGYLFPL